MKICNACASESWSGSLFGKPKIRIICGNCSAPTASRDWMDLGRPHRISVYCSHCGYWNSTGLVLA